MKKVLIMGATGTLGSAVRHELLKKTDDQITLFARSADQLSPHPQERIISGNVMNEADLDSAIKGQDVVFVAVRGALGVFAAKIIAAMERAQVSRLIFTTSMGIYNEVPNVLGGSANLAHNPDLQPYREAADRIEASDLNYTILRPGKFMRGPVNYDITLKGEPFKGQNATIASIADLVLRLTEDGHLYSRESIGITTPNE